MSETYPKYSCQYAATFRITSTLWLMGSRLNIWYFHTSVLFNSYQAKDKLHGCVYLSVQITLGQDSGNSNILVINVI